METAMIQLPVNDAGQLLIGADAVIPEMRRLKPDAEAFIVEAAEMFSFNKQIHLVISIRNIGEAGVDEIEVAIREHFSYLQKRAARQVTKAVHLGWRSLIISIVFFVAIVSLTLAIVKRWPEGQISLMFRELLIILGWVALWRPADLLLYEWRPLKREARLYQQLAQCKVEIIN